MGDLLWHASDLSPTNRLTVTRSHTEILVTRITFGSWQHSGGGCISLPISAIMGHHHFVLIKQYVLLLIEYIWINTSLLFNRQVFTDNEERPGEKRIYSMLFDNRHDRLLTGETYHNVTHRPRCHDPWGKRVFAKLKYRAKTPSLL